MPLYANKTTVSVEKSRMEIEKMLHKYGATDFATGWAKGASGLVTSAMIGFSCRDRMVRFVLPILTKDDKRICRDKNNWKYSDSVIEQRWQQDQRSRWRALALVIKAKLEAVESGITTFEQEFLAHIVMPGGQTVGDQITARIEQAYASGRPLALLPEISGARED